MNKNIRNTIELLLSKEYYCESGALSEKGTIFTVNPETDELFVKILAYRNCVIVCTSRSVQVKIEKLLRNRSRDEIFELPYVYGQTIHYVPDVNREYSGHIKSGYTSACIWGDDILSLIGISGFENSLSFDKTGKTPAKALCIAKYNDKIVGMAGAAATSTDGVWEVGVDVVIKHRNAGLASYLVSALTKELLAQGIVPFYSASVTNIGSQMVANRCGYIPFWIDTFGTIFDKHYVYDKLILNFNER